MHEKFESILHLLKGHIFLDVNLIFKNPNARIACFPEQSFCSGIGADCYVLKVAQVLEFHQFENTLVAHHLTVFTSVVFGAFDRTVIFKAIVGAVVFRVIEGSVVFRVILGSVVFRAIVGSVVFRAIVGTSIEA